MKKLRFIILVLICSGLVSCSSSSGGGSSPDPLLSVTDLAFDSLTYELKASVNADDGTKISLTCNDAAETAVVSAGKILLSFTSPFVKGAKGGKKYQLVFAADGYKSTASSIEYWPELLFEAASREEVTVYNGGTEHLVLPEILLLNYDASAVTEDWCFEANGVEMLGWNIDSMKEWLSDMNNDGKSAKACFSLTPNCSNGKNLEKKGFVTYTCKKDILVKSVYIVNKWGMYEACLYKGEIMDDETAGGEVDYQWQISDDAINFTDIEGADGKILTFSRDNYSSYERKTLRVKITQTFEGNKQATLESQTLPVLHMVKKADLYYDGSLAASSHFDVKKIRGSLTDEFGSIYDASAFEWTTVSELEENGDYIGIYSRNYFVTANNDSFYDDGESVFVVVQSVLNSSELPSLSTDQSNISAGKIKFASVDKSLECSFDGGATYSDFPEGEIASAAGKIIYIRKKASGSPNTSGYIKESQPLEIKVAKENIGRKTSGGGLISGVTMPELALSSSVKNGVVYVCPEIKNIDSPDDFMYVYSWFVDGVEVSSAHFSDAVVENKDSNRLEINKAKLSALKGKGVYQICCMVTLELDLEIGGVFRLSSQLSVSVD